MVWHGWEANGVRGQGDLPPLAGQSGLGLLLVCGGGRGLHEDVARAPDRAAVMGINLAFLCVRRPVQHLASMHENLVRFWMGLYRQHSEDHVHTHSHRHFEAVDMVWDLEGQPPCSGLFGAVAGLAMGYDPVWLCGVPEDNGGHFYDPPGVPGNYLTGTNEDSWRWHREHVFAGRVKSFSGRTRDWLGAPDGL